MFSIQARHVKYSSLVWPTVQLAHAFAASRRALATKDTYNTADTVNVWVCVNAELMQHRTNKSLEMPALTALCTVTKLSAARQTHETQLRYENTPQTVYTIK